MKPRDYDDETFTSTVGARLKKFSTETLSKRMVGFTFSRAWIYVAFFNSLLLAAHSDAARTQSSLYTLSLVALVVTLSIGGFADKLFNRLFESAPGKLCPAIIITIGTSLIPFATTASSAGLVALIAAAIFTGIGSGLLALGWGIVYARVGGPTAAAEVPMAFLLATLLVPLYMILPFVAAFAIVLLLPIASSLVLFRELGESRPIDDLRTADADAPADTAAPKTSPKWNRILLKFTSGSMVFGIIICVVRSISEVFTNSSQFMFSVFSTTVASAVACIICLIVLFFKKHLSFGFTYRPVLLLMALGCLALPLLGYYNGLLPLLLTSAGYFCFEIINWVILSDAAFRLDVPPLKVFGYGRAAVSTGVLSGTLLVLPLNAENMPFEVRASITLAAVFVLIVTYTFTLTEKDIDQMIGTHDDDAQSESSAKTTAELCDDLADCYELGARAREVMVLLAKGRSNSRIEQELYMSKGTVNTHLRRIFQKLNIHTRQELIDMIDEMSNGERRKEHGDR